MHESTIVLGNFYAEEAGVCRWTHSDTGLRRRIPDLPAPRLYPRPG